MEEAMKDGCEGWTTRRAPHMEKYAEIRDVVVEGAPEACRLSLKVDSQSFLIGDYFETRAEFVALLSAPAAGAVRGPADENGA